MKGDELKYLLLLIAALCCCSACKKDKETQNCHLISPQGNNVSSFQASFHWNSCCNDTQVVYLINSNAIVDSIKTINTNFIYNKMLLAGETYKWFVKCQNAISDTLSFNVAYPDPFVVGKYNVVVSYHESYGGGYQFDTTYGNSTIQITKTTDGSLRVSDTSLLHVLFEVGYSAFFSNFYQEMFYGYPPENYIGYDYHTQKVTVRSGSFSAGGNWGTNWIGNKVP